MTDRDETAIAPTGQTVSVTRRIEASRDELWAAVAEPREIARWQADAARGRVEPGGSLELGWPGLGATVLLDVDEVRRPSRLGLRNGTALVRFEVETGTVSVSQSGITSGDEAEGVLSSWAMTLGVLDHYLKLHAGSDRRVYWMAQRVRTSAETAHLFFTEEPALRTWLTRNGHLGETGQAYSFELDGGQTMSGEVLARVPGRDVLLSWQEDGGSSLMLRTLPTADSDERMVLLAWSRWTTDPPDPHKKALLEAALDRLARTLDSPGMA